MIDDILNRSKNALVDKGHSTDSLYKLELLSNDKEPFLNTLNDLIRDCDEFYFSVAFISESGLRGIMVSLNETKANGKIIIGNKSNFSHPKAIKLLNENRNIELKMDIEGNLHTKGFFFRKGDVWTIIVGSSNLTISALKTNKEWNLIIDSHCNGNLVFSMLEEFEKIWNNAYLIEEVIVEYERVYNLNKENRFTIPKSTIKPNQMQIKALKGIEYYRKNDNCALVISATGTGKTYLSAFDVRSSNPNRVLFIVHRENIARKAMDTFKQIMPKKNMGIYIAQQKDRADYLFTTIQTLSKDDVLKSFAKEYFDYIIIDEVHHAGSISYQKIINYFKPNFLLGMSATPQRMDGYNIYDLFKYNIAYEISLRDAIEDKLIVPFHYYGISEIMIDGKVIDEKSIYNMEDKAKHVVEKSKQYGYNGEKVKGLIFIDNIKNAKMLSEELNLLGYKTQALTSEDNETIRYKAIDRLSKNIDEDYLDFIISVDIFNEGIDIPCVNQVILMRPTNSIIVYLQQLGRGLRKSSDKNYLVVLDFIGNYQNNFMIPLALLDNNASEISKLNMFIESGSQLVGGECTISFEYQAKELIYEKISIRNLSRKNIIVENYFLLKQRLNRIPLLNDFYSNKISNPEYIIKYKNYYELVNQIEKKEIYTFNSEEKNFLDFLYQEYLPVKRVHEVIVLKELFSGNKSLDQINENIEKYLGIKKQKSNTKNAFDNLSFNILELDNTRRKYKPLIIDGDISKCIKDSFNNKKLFNELINDWINYSLLFINDNYVQDDVTPLLLNHTYTRKEAFYLQNLEYNPGFQVGGYTKTSDGDSIMIFMRADNSIYINDIFDRSKLVFYSKSNRRVEGA
ncbi:MAG: DEAD/DEAH box helicase family protein, partial [Erysipelotrichales bacterium]